MEKVNAGKFRKVVEQSLWRIRVKKRKLILLPGIVGAQTENAGQGLSTTYRVLYFCCFLLEALGNLVQRKNYETRGIDNIDRQVVK